MTDLTPQLQNFLESQGVVPERRNTPTDDPALDRALKAVDRYKQEVTDTKSDNLARTAAVAAAAPLKGALSMSDLPGYAVGGVAMGLGKALQALGAEDVGDDISRFGSFVLEHISEKGPTATVRKTLSEATDGLTDPKTGLQRVVGAAGEAVGAGAPMGMIKGARSAGQFALGGAGAQTAAEFDASLPVQLLAGMVAPSALSAPKAAKGAIQKGIASASESTQEGQNMREAVAQWIANRKTIKNQMSRMAATRRAREGAALEARTGVSMSLDKLTQDPRLQIVAARLARDSRTADIARAKLQQSIRQTKNFIEKTSQKISPIDADNQILADDIAKAVDNRVKELASLRRDQAAKDFAVVKGLTGNKKVIPMKNFNRFIEDEIATKTSQSSDQKKKFIKDLKRRQKAMLGKRGYPLVSPAEMQDLLQDFGDASSGIGTPFGKLDKSFSKKQAGRVLQVIQEDLNQAAEAMPFGSPAAASLKRARDNYNEAMNMIDKLKNSTIGQKFNVVFVDGVPQIKTPDTLVHWFKSMTSPTSIRRAIKQLDELDPEFAPRIGKQYLNDLMSKATKTTKDDPRQMARNIFKGLQNEKDIISAFVRDKSIRQDIDRITRVAKRLASSGDALASGDEIMSTLARIKASGWVSPQAISYVFQSYIAPRYMADILFNSKNRSLFMGAQKGNAKDAKTLMDRLGILKDATQSLKDPAIRGTIGTMATQERE